MGFLKGRYIHEAIGTTHKGLHFTKIKNQLAMVIKLDMSKACDIKKWLSFRLILIHVLFNLSTGKWFMDCVTYVRFSLLINGEIPILFKSSKIFSQG